MNDNSAFMVWYWHWVNQIAHKLRRRYIRKLCIKHLRQYGISATKRTIWTDWDLLWEFLNCLYDVLGQNEHLDPAAKEMIEEVIQKLKDHPKTVDFERNMKEFESLRKEKFEQDMRELDDAIKNNKL